MSRLKNFQQDDPFCSLLLHVGITMTKPGKSQRVPVHFKFTCYE